MKTLIMLAVGVLLLPACGGFKIGLDDETINLAECLRHEESCPEDDGAEAVTEEDGTDSGEVDGTNGDDEETGGGVVIEDYERVDGAYFLGTYQAVDFNADYWMVADKCEYNFPKIIRAYSHGDEIDFETSGGGLAFTAAIYPDETFDFDVLFQNSVGQPTVQVTCTCEIWETDNKYNSDQIQCGCENGERDLCLAYWEVK